MTPFIFEMFRTPFSVSRFLNLSSIDISGWIILCYGGSAPRRIFSNIPVLYPLNATSALPPSSPSVCNQSCLQTLPDVPWRRLWVGGKGRSVAKLPWWRAVALYEML